MFLIIANNSSKSHAEDINKNLNNQNYQSKQHRSRAETNEDESKIKQSHNTSANKPITKSVMQSNRQNTLTEPKSPNFATKPRQRSVINFYY